MATCTLPIERVLLDGGLYCASTDEHHISNMVNAWRRIHLELVNLCVLAKGVAGQGGFYRNRHELVFVWRKGSCSRVNRIELGKHGRNRTNVWKYPDVIGFGAERAATRSLHPTVKSMLITKDLILNCTSKGRKRRSDPTFRALI